MRYILYSALLLITAQCTRMAPSQAGSPPPTHEKWTLLLKKHVDMRGMVNYRGFLKDSAQLSSYITRLGENPPDLRNWSEKEQLAYYINLYNAATIQLVLRHYPVESIRDIGSRIQIPFVNTPWQVEFIKIGNKYYDLDNVEHNIIRKNYGEPRIHFALVCAAVSCPPLRNEAYVAERLDAQLRDQARVFLSDNTKNEVGGTAWKLSKIFDWYGGDFDSVGGVEAYISEVMNVGKPERVSYKPYNWTLNEQ